MYNVYGYVHQFMGDCLIPLDPWFFYIHICIQPYSLHQEKRIITILSDNIIVYYVFAICIMFVLVLASPIAYCFQGVHITFFWEGWGGGGGGGRKGGGRGFFPLLKF